MRYLLLLLILSSCGVSRETFKAQVDQTAHVRDSLATLKQVHASTLSDFERERQHESSTEILFDTLYRDTGRIVTKVEYFPDGRLKSVEGSVIALRQRLSDKEAERISLSEVVDSLMNVDHVRDSVVVYKERVVNKEVKRRSWWWLWLAIGLVGGLVIGNNWRRIKTKLFG